MSNDDTTGGLEEDPATGRRRNPRSQQAILEATTELLTEVGYQGVTIEGVAARAGVGKATVYRWWPTKPALVSEAIGHRLPLPPIPETGDSRADLRAAIRASIATFTGPPTGVVIPALAADLMRDPEGATHFQQFLATRRASVLRILRHAAERGDLPSNVDGELILSIYAGTVFYRTLISGEPVTDHHIDQLIDLILDGRTPVKDEQTGIAPGATPAHRLRTE